MRRVDPNPPSPYATADPEYRHLIPAFLGLTPEPGFLCYTACERMTVAPEGTLEDFDEAFRSGRVEDLPEGLCPVCINVVTGREQAELMGGMSCRDCHQGSSQGDLCALCRQDHHNEWRGVPN